MKNVRKILCAMLAALVAVSATACSGDGGNGGTASTDSAASGETSSWLRRRVSRYLSNSGSREPKKMVFFTKLR